MGRASFPFLLLAAALGAACASSGVGDAGTLDAAPADGGVADAGAADSGAPDTGPSDAAPTDTGFEDTGVEDAGLSDTGLDDAGLDDAGLADAGLDDAGLADAGPSDSGALLRDDAGCPLPSGAVDDPLAAGLPTGLVLWLRGDHGVATLADGTSVCRWEDVSGNGRHFTPVGAAMPTYTSSAVAGRPAVVFSTGRRLERADVLGLGATQGRTIAARTQIADTTRRFGTLLQGDRGTNWRYLELEQNTFNTVGRRVGVYLTANAYDSDVATSTAARTHVYAISTIVPGTVLPAALSYAVDGVERSLTRTPGGNGPSGPGNNRVWDFSGAGFTSIGETGAPGFAGGAVGEVLVFDHALSAPERAAVEAHLSR